MPTAWEDQSVDYGQGESRAKLELAGFERRPALIPQSVDDEHQRSGIIAFGLAERLVGIDRSLRKGHVSALLPALLEVDLHVQGVVHHLAMAKFAAGDVERLDLDIESLAALAFADEVRPALPRNLRLFQAAGLQPRA